MTCEYCEQGGYIFNKACPGCRQRLVMGEWCKVKREEMARELERQFDFLPDWRVEPHCGCERICKRKAAINAEQAQPSAAPPSRRR